MLVEQAMEKAESVTKTAINEHWQAFLSQMRDKLGVENITLEEPYLMFEITKNTLQYLKRLDNLQMSLTSGAGIGEQHIPSRIELEKTRHIISVKQNMDSVRQQEFGITQYIWRCSNDACPTCAPLDGQIFTWDSGDQPGQTHPNCQCSAEPFLGGDGEPANYPVQDKILEMIILLASITPWGRAAKIGRIAVGRLGKVGERIINSTGANKPPPPKPTEKPTTEKPVSTNPDNSKSAEKIANGHAYDKHVMKKGDFPEIKSKEDFKKYIEDILNNPSETKNLERGRTGYWDSKTKTSIITDPNNPDGGTIFKPSNGKDYFDRLE